MLIYASLPARERGRAQSCEIQQIFDPRIVEEEEEMLPTASKGRTASNVRANPVFPQYLRRIVKVALAPDHAAQWRKIDLSLVTLANGKCGLHYPIEVHILLDDFYILNGSDYQNGTRDGPMGRTMLSLKPSLLNAVMSTSTLSTISKTKNQWARDDPAFIVICSFLLAVSTLSYCAAHRNLVCKGILASFNHPEGFGKFQGTTHAVFVIISVLLIHFLLIGVVLATCCWFLTNNYLREEAPNSHVVEQRVECDTLFSITTSGYDVLPFLERTTFFLYPIGVVIVLSPILILSGFNPSRYFMNMYFSQWQ
ncbi:unnamed protein product [Camellia sinensis]